MRITFRASEPALITSFPGPAFFDHSLLVPDPTHIRPVGSEAAARRPEPEAHLLSEVGRLPGSLTHTLFRDSLRTPGAPLTAYDSAAEQDVIRRPETQGRRPRSLGRQQESLVSTARSLGMHTRVQPGPPQHSNRVTTQRTHQRPRCVPRKRPTPVHRSTITAPK